jgi:hypothetical protein
MFLNNDINIAIDRLSRKSVTFSGSFALIMQDILPKERVVHDIDLVFRSEEEIDKLVESFKGLLTKVIMEDRKGKYPRDHISLSFKDLSVKIDAFICPTEVPIIRYGYYMSYYYSIIEAKLRIILNRKGYREDEE